MPFGRCARVSTSGVIAVGVEERERLYKCNGQNTFKIDSCERELDMKQKAEEEELWLSGNQLHIIILLEEFPSHFPDAHWPVSQQYEGININETNFSSLGPPWIFITFE